MQNIYWDLLKKIKKKRREELNPYLNQMKIDLENLV